MDAEEFTILFRCLGGDVFENCHNKRLLEPQNSPGGERGHLGVEGKCRQPAGWGSAVGAGESGHLDRETDLWGGPSGWTDGVKR